MDRDTPVLLFLVGAKGSGKSFIGTLLERELNIPFLRAEPIWKALKEDPNVPAADYIAHGTDAIVAAAKAIAEHAPVFSMETTGAFDDVDAFIDRFRPFSRPLLIQIRANPDTCLRRVHTRDQAVHINVSDSYVKQINARSFALRLPYAAAIENDPEADEGDILEVVQRLVEINPS